MDWKLAENIRLNKTCRTCFYGTTLTNNDNFDMCLYLTDLPNLSPRIKTCLNWKEEEEEI